MMVEIKGYHACPKLLEACHPQHKEFPEFNPNKCYNNNSGLRFID